MPTRVGIDLVRVADVRDALDAHGAHYLARVYTDNEVDDCRGTAGPDPRRLAARFAAKEAAAKALRVHPDEALPWTAIEVVRDADGFPALVLHGAAAELAGARGITDLVVSLSHEDEYAAAVVSAELVA